MDAISNRHSTPDPLAETVRSVDEPVGAEDLVALLAAFMGFLDAGEADRAAALWDVPALILGDAHVHGPLSLDRLASWLREIDARDPDDESARRAPGDVLEPTPAWSSQPLVRRLEWISARVAVVDTPWPRRPRGGLLTGSEGTTFLIRVDQFGQPKIRGLLLHSRGQRASLL